MKRSDVFLIRLIDKLNSHVFSRRVAESNLSLGGTAAQAEFKIEPVEVNQSQVSPDRSEVKASCFSEQITSNNPPEHDYASSIVVIEDDEEDEDVKELKQESMGISAATQYGTDPLIQTSREETYRGLPSSEYAWGDDGRVRNKECSRLVGEETSQYSGYRELRKSSRTVSSSVDPGGAPGASTKGGKKLICMYCGKHFAFYSVMKEHVRRHTGEKPYQCSYCPKRFCHKPHRKRHESIHTGQKPFPCSFCSKRFMNNSNRKTHEQTHLREQSYPCRYCGRLFKNQGYRTNHERIHELQR